MDPDDSPFKGNTRAVLEHLLKASTTLGGKACNEALDMAAFYIAKAGRDADTLAERELLIHLAHAGIAIGKRHRAVLDLFIEALETS